MRFHVQNEAIQIQLLGVIEVLETTEEYFKDDNEAQVGPKNVSTQLFSCTAWTSTE